MRVELRFFAGLREVLPPGEAPHLAELPDGTTVRRVLETYGVPEEKPKILLVNGRHAAPEQELREGDVLSVFPPVAGG